MDYTRKLKEVVVGMLKENTGQHLLDSGGAYGRHWQRNQTRDFDKEPACKVQLSGKEDGTIDEVMVYYNLYHFMINFLELDKDTDKINKQFQKFATSDTMKEESWEDCLDEFRKKKKLDYKGGYYTYNQGGECILDQDIVYDFVASKDNDYVIIRVHGGCDARSGFSSPVFFKYGCEEGAFLNALTQVYAYCTGVTPELSTKKGDLFNSPEIRCGLTLDSYNGGYSWDDAETGQRVRLDDVAYYDMEGECLRCVKCKSRIEFSVADC